MTRKENRTFISRLWAGRQAYLFLLPIFTGLIVFMYFPAFKGIYNSFFNMDQFGNKTFIGLNNFKELFNDQLFISSIPTMFKLMVPKLVIGIIVPLIMAELIFFVSSKRLQYFYRVTCLLPMVAPGVVFILIWQTIYEPNSGLAVSIARLFGIVSANQNIDWLGNPHLVIPSIIFMGFPWIGGTAVLIYMSGLMNIAGEIREASLLDGASTFKRILTIDIPLIIGQVRYFLIFGIIGGFQDYGTQIVLTHGGPGYTTYVPGYYMFKQAFTYNRMGYASAIGTLMFVVIFIFTILMMRFIKNKE